MGYKIFGFFIQCSIATVVGGGCQQMPSRPLYVSQIDARYIVRKHKESQASTGVSFYRVSLNKTLGSICKQYPSDSHYAALVINRCGPFRGTILSFARFSKEEDNFMLGKPRISHRERLIHADLDLRCDFF